METPIPNFYFMGVQFLHLLALSVWVGGIILIQGVMTPTLFKSLPAQPMAEHLVYEVSLKFHHITLFCTATLIITGVIKFLRWENLTPWNFIRYAAICVMSLVSLYMAFKMNQKKQAFLLSEASEGEEGLQQEPLRNNHFNLLSGKLMMLSLVCGVTALLMA